MQKFRVLFLLLGFWLCGQGFLYAQEDTEDDVDSDYNEDDVSVETDYNGYISELYSRGDQTFTISLGVLFPLAFYNNRELIEHHFNPPVGGMGVLGYTYFLNAHYFLGGEIGVKFNYTLGQNTIFLIPIGLRTGWQFLIRRFEIPLSITVGVAPQRYLNFSYVGLFMKYGGSVYFRFNPDWSFGMSVDGSWYPQWPKEDGRRVPKKDINAHILGLTLAARYHF